MISLCDGTACHVKGAEDIHEAMTDELAIPKGGDTDPDRQYTIQKVACLGCCSLAPAMQIDGVTYAHASQDGVPDILDDFERRQEDDDSGDEDLTRKVREQGAEIRVGLDSCCVASGTDRIELAIEKALRELGSDVPVKHVSCVHMCHQVPVIEVIEPDKKPSLYVKVEEEDVSAIVARHFKPLDPMKLIRSSVMRWTEHLYGGIEEEEVVERHADTARDEHVATFLDGQMHIATEHRGDIDPASLDEYLQRGGFMAFEKVLFGKATGHILLKRKGVPVSPPNGNSKPWTQQQIIDEFMASGLRGRGGAGFPSGRKLQFVHDAPGDKKYIICNGDEGDPGAFMDRMILESYSFRVIEGMLLAALAVGADEGYFYIRAEYPLATKQHSHSPSSELRRSRHFLATTLSNSRPIRFALKVKEGAGAFRMRRRNGPHRVARGASRGMPTIPPAVSGHQPASTANPRSSTTPKRLAMVPWIIRNGAEEVRGKLGTDRSKGTKVFSLAGKIRQGGLIEVPMGITINEIVHKHRRRY